MRKGRREKKKISLLGAMLANASVSLLKRLGRDIVQGPLSSTGCTVNVCLAADVLVQGLSDSASLPDTVVKELRLRTTV